MNIFFKVALLLLISMHGFPSMSQETHYRVLHVNGTITAEGKTNALKTGDTLTVKNQLHCAHRNAWLVLVETNGEQYFAGASEEALTLSIPASLQAIEHAQHPVHRASKAPVENLRTYFAGAQFVFIGHDFFLEVDPKNYPLNDQLFLLYRYEYQSRIITHKLPQKKNVVHFNKEYLYEYKGDTIPYAQTSNTELTYFNSNTNLPAYAAGFRPLWLEEDALRAELLTLQQALQNKGKRSRDDWKKLFLQYVQDIYGKTDEIIFMTWVEEKVL